jgi:hypothetical protein
MIAALVRWLFRGPGRVAGRPVVGRPQVPSAEDDRGAGI